MATVEKTSLAATQIGRLLLKHKSITQASKFTRCKKTQLRSARDVLILWRSYDVSNYVLKMLVKDLRSGRGVSTKEIALGASFESVYHWQDKALSERPFGIVAACDDEHDSVKQKLQKAVSGHRKRLNQSSHS